MEWWSIIKAYRSDNGLSQAELARKIGVAQATIARYELGYFNPKTDVQDKLSNLIGLKESHSSQHQIIRVVNNLWPNAVFSKEGDYLAMSYSAWKILVDLSIDAGQFAELYQQQHFEKYINIAHDEGFFAGKVASINIVRPWMRRNKVDGHLDIVWTPLLLKNVGIVVETNFMKSIGSEGQLDTDQAFRVNSNHETGSDRREGVQIVRACGRGWQHYNPATMNQMIQNGGNSDVSKNRHELSLRDRTAA